MLRYRLRTYGESDPTGMLVTVHRIAIQLLYLRHYNDKAKPAERQGRKATGPRFLFAPVDGHYRYGERHETTNKVYPKDFYDRRVFLFYSLDCGGEY